MSIKTEIKIKVLFENYGYSINKMLEKSKALFKTKKQIVSKRYLLSAKNNIWSFNKIFEFIFLRKFLFKNNLAWIEIYYELKKMDKII